MANNYSKFWAESDPKPVSKSASNTGTKVGGAKGRKKKRIQFSLSDEAANRLKRLPKGSKSSYIEKLILSK